MSRLTCAPLLFVVLLALWPLRTLAQAPEEPVYDCKPLRSSNKTSGTEVDVRQVARSWKGAVCHDLRSHADCVFRVGGASPAAGAARRAGRRAAARKPPGGD